MIARIMGKVAKMSMRTAERDHLTEPQPIECEGGFPIIRKGEDHCEEDECQYCCQHDEFDHDICLACGYERDPGEAIDRAMDAREDR